MGVPSHHKCRRSYGAHESFIQKIKASDRECWYVVEESVNSDELQETNLAWLVSQPRRFPRIYFDHFGAQ